MDALRSAGRALVRSPRLATQSWTAGRHTKLPENWTDTRETVVEGMTFNLRLLGTTLVDRPKGEELSAAAVKRIVATAKAGGKKPQKVALKVSPRGIVLHDSATDQLLENVSIYRISYCTVDALHDKVFAYIAQNAVNGTLECHAYLCSKRKWPVDTVPRASPHFCGDAASPVPSHLHPRKHLHDLRRVLVLLRKPIRAEKNAQAVALTVAQAFTVAFELWQVAREEKGRRAKLGSSGEAGSSSRSETSDSLGSLRGTDVATDQLLDFGDSANVVVESNGNIEEDRLDNQRPSEPNNNPLWEAEDALDEAFSRLAVSRTNPQVLDVGVTPETGSPNPTTEPLRAASVPSGEDI